ncbi:hypothetical protein F66182_7562 [Fusarium sp. NRRL 66182]|nr:hypothetical protein F66182_7562 [Fusarium sp. NRRL 66182]
MDSKHNDNGPPSAFLKARFRVQKQKKRESRSRTSDSQAAEAESPPRIPDLDTHRAVVERPAVLPVSSDDPDIEPVPRQPTVDDASRAILRRPIFDIAPVSHMPDAFAFAVEKSKLSQHNSQHNTQNTYNYTYTQNTYGNTTGPPPSSDHDNGGGGGGGGSWNMNPFSLPGCALPLLVIVLVIVGTILAALYGVMTAWSNTVGLVQYSFNSLASLVTFGYFASPIGASSPTSVSTVTTTMTSTSTSTTIGVTPTPIVRRPRGIKKAISDVNEWIERLTGEDIINSYAMVGRGGVRLHGLGEVGPMWTITQEDIAKLERELQSSFGRLYKDLMYHVENLDSYPASTCLLRQDNLSPWETFLSWFSWLSSNPSPKDIARSNYETSEGLHARTLEAYTAVSRKTLESVINRLDKLSEGICDLRDQVEGYGRNLPRQSRNEEVGEGIAALTKQRVMVIEKDLADGLDSEEELGGIRDDIKPRLSKVQTLMEFRQLEHAMVSWVQGFAKGVGRLHRLDGRGRPVVT